MTTAHTIHGHYLVRMSSSLSILRPILGISRHINQFASSTGIDVQVLCCRGVKPSLPRLAGIERGGEVSNAPVIVAPAGSMNMHLCIHAYLTQEGYGIGQLSREMEEQKQKQKQKRKKKKKKRRTWFD